MPNQSNSNYWEHLPLYANLIFDKYSADYPEVNYKLWNTMNGYNEKPFWIVWNKDENQPVCHGAALLTYASEREALAKAESMANNNPGRTYYTLSVNPVAKSTTASVVTTRL